MKQQTVIQNFARAAARAALIATGIGAAACSDSAGPGRQDAELPVADGSFHQHLRWANAPKADQFSAVAHLPTGTVDLLPNPVTQAFFDDKWYDWDGTDVFSVSFYAVRGEEREINVVIATATQTLKFLELEITEPTHRPNGSTIALGDSVLITVTIDPSNLAVDLQPTGIRFGNTYPTELELSYQAASLDFNTDGAVNSFDYYIQSNLLGIWMREQVGDPWVFLEGVHNQNAKEFEVFLEHFSGYAVSW